MLFTAWNAPWSLPCRSSRSGRKMHSQIDPRAGPEAWRVVWQRRGRLSECLSVTLEMFVDNDFLDGCVHFVGCLTRRCAGKDPGFGITDFWILTLSFSRHVFGGCWLTFLTWTWVEGIMPSPTVLSWMLHAWQTCSPWEIKCLSLVSVEQTPDQNTRSGKWRVPSVLGARGRRLPRAGGEQWHKGTTSHSRGPDPARVPPTPPGRPVPPDFPEKEWRCREVNSLAQDHTTKCLGQESGEKVGKIGRAESYGGLNVGGWVRSWYWHEFDILFITICRGCWWWRRRGKRIHFL